MIFRRRSKFNDKVRFLVSGRAMFVIVGARAIVIVVRVVVAIGRASTSLTP
jgi:cytosine/uracil/thiamine/allantoin permease